jgi:hypothetical protein
VNELSTRVIGWMTVMFAMLAFGQVGPARVTRVKARGLVSGLPQAQRVTGNPCRSTRTAVPACSTATNAVAWPLTKP